MASPDTRSTGRWTFLTNHARVLLGIARDPQARLRDVAATAGITERAAQAIVADLEAAGYITRTRVGRRNRYTIDPRRGFRHPAEADQRIEGLLALFAHREPPRDEGGAGPGAGRPLSAVASSASPSGVSATATLPAAPAGSPGVADSPNPPAAAGR